MFATGETVGLAKWIIVSSVLFGSILKSGDGRTDGSTYVRTYDMPENSDHYRPCVGQPSGSKEVLEKESKEVLITKYQTKQNEYKLANPLTGIQICMDKGKLAFQSLNWAKSLFVSSLASQVFTDFGLMM